MQNVIKGFSDSVEALSTAPARAPKAAPKTSLKPVYAGGPVAEKQEDK